MGKISGLVQKWKICIYVKNYNGQCCIYYLEIISTSFILIEAIVKNNI
jgi:hypothetical protein